jgi:hypothetical protein
MSGNRQRERPRAGCPDAEHLRLRFQKILLWRKFRFLVSLIMTNFCY